MKKSVTSTQEEVKKVETKQPITIHYSGQNYNGVINYLKQKSNINDEINLSCSSKHFGELRDPFYTKSEKDSWICIEFKNYYIIPTSYTLKSHHNSPGRCQPRNWVIEGSLDNQHWNIIDEQYNCSYLNDYCMLHNFAINSKKDVKEFKFIRIRLTGQNWLSTFNLTLCYIELYEN